MYIGDPSKLNLDISGTRASGNQRVGSFLQYVADRQMPEGDHTPVGDVTPQNSHLVENILAKRYADMRKNSLMSPMALRRVASSNNADMQKRKYTMN